MKKTLPRLLVMAIALLLTITVSRAQINLTAPDSSYQQNFNALSATGTANDSSSLPNGWAFAETGTNANATYAASTGSSTSGNTYSLGVDGDRAFGGLQSGSLVPFIGAGFRNSTADTITSLQINYVGEQWRLGATPRAQADRLDFQYSTNAFSLLSGTWTDYDSLDFSAPIQSGAVGPLDGNASANVMNWNLEFFGATREEYPDEYGPANESLQLSNVQRVINSVHADVIAVQEVSNDSLFSELIRELPGYNAITRS